MRRDLLGNVRVTDMARGPPSATVAPASNSRTGSTAPADRPPQTVSLGSRSRLLMYRPHRLRREWLSTWAAPRRGARSPRSWYPWISSSAHDASGRSDDDGRRIGWPGRRLDVTVQHGDTGI